MVVATRGAILGGEGNARVKIGDSNFGGLNAFKGLRRVHTTDCEGPVSKDDNAADLARHFIPCGDLFFPLVSKIDDVWADNITQPGYKAGDTLRLILPFLRAYGATNEGIMEFSSENIHLVPGSKETLRRINEIMPSFMISTSYRPYISALSKVTGFPEENIYCTELDIDKYHLPENERRKIMELREEIVGIPMVEIPDGASKLEDFSERDQSSIRRLYEIFWRTIPGMGCGRMLEEVNPIGGREKANAINDIAKRLGAALAEFVYCADSITDVEAFRLIRKGGGVTISFNGNKYAVREAEVCVMSPNALPSSILAYAFNCGGKRSVMELVTNWSYDAIKNTTPFYEEMKNVFPYGLPEVTLVNSNNMEDLARRSSAFRKTVRGEYAGRLG